MKKVVLISIILLLMQMQIVSADNSASCQMVSDKTTVQVGDTFTVELWLDLNYFDTGFTLRQMKFNGSLANMIDRNFSNGWVGEYNDIGDLDNDEGNLTYAMANNFSGVSGNHCVMYFEFEAIDKGVFLIEIPYSINFGTGSGNVGMELAFADSFYWDNNLTVVIEEDDEQPPNPNPNPPNPNPPNPQPTPPDDEPDDQTNYTNNSDIEPDNNQTNQTDEPEPTPQQLHADAGGPYYAKVGETILFDGTNSTGNISYWEWNFGNIMGSTTYSKVTNSYDKPGNYTISLTIYDSTGRNDTVFTNAFINGSSISDNEGQDNEDEGGEESNSIYGSDTNYYIVLIISIIGIGLFIYYYNKRKEKL